MMEWTDSKKKFRNEMKFLCTDMEMTIIRANLLPFLRLDQYVDPEQGHYTISSLYFDDYEDSCFYENEYSIGIRRKYRIRTYNWEKKVIRLEKKAKDNTLSRKTDCALTEAEYHQICAGDVAGLFWQTEDELLKEFCLEIMTKLFQPKVIVSYERTAFVDFPGNVRVTLDRNITASWQKNRFLDFDHLNIPVLPAGTHLLEIKFDEFLPDYIKQAIQMDGLYQTTFSKYFMARSAIQAFGR